MDASAALSTRGFSGYFVPIQLSAANLFTLARQDSVDLALSRVILNDEQPVGVAFIAVRGWTSRLAAMSIVPEARGHGIGKLVMAQLFDEAKARGNKAMELEVIAQNTAAVHLYEKCGFQKVRRLVGYNGQIPPNTSETQLEQVDIREVARALIAHGPGDLPWQISGETLAQIGAPNLAYRRDASFVVISDPNAQTVNIRAIVTLAQARRRGQASHLLRALSAQYPEKTWRVTPIFPEEVGGLFEQLGMQRDHLSQWQMSVQLS